MARTVGDIFWDRLHQWGVRRVQGYPGHGIDGLLGALDRMGAGCAEVLLGRDVLRDDLPWVTGAIGLLGLRYPCEVKLEGDAAGTLAALRLLPKKGPRWRTTIAECMRDWDREVEDRAQARANPVSPQGIFTELSPRLPDRAIVTSDSGACANWFARDLTIRRGVMASLSENRRRWALPCPVPPRPSPRTRTGR